MSRNHIQVAIVFFFVVLPCSLGLAKEPEESKSPEDDARLVYNHLLKEYSSGKTGIERLELLNTWSLRMMSAEARRIQRTIQGGGVDVVARPIREHVARMDRVRQEALVLTRRGKVPRAELAAARHLYWMSTKIESDAIAAAKAEMKDKPTAILPPAEYSQPSPDALVLKIDDEGNVYVDGKQFSRKQFQEKLERYVASGVGKGQVVMKISRHCRQKHVSAIMMQCEKAGCTKFLTQVQEKD